MRRTFLNVLSPFFLTALLTTNTAAADMLSVASVDSFEKKTCELKGADTADIDVYLKSSGEPLDKITVVLIVLGDFPTELEETTDEYGHTVFRNLPAANYRLKVKKTESTGVSVAIGDFIVNNSKDRFKRK